MGKVIGIDLGTTNSCVAFIDDGKPVVIPDPDGKRTTPSVYAISSTQEPLVGYPAKRQAETNRLNTIFAVKRLIGRKFTSDEVLEASEKLPYKIVPADNNDAWVEINGVPTSPEEVSANILSKMREIAEQHLGEQVQHAVITVPAHFNDAQRQATKDAGRIAGLDVLRIINEPTAAALAYGLDLIEASSAAAPGTVQAEKPDRTIAVFDLGGGTFDVTILALKEGVFDVLSTHGDTFLGGEDFDLAIVNYLLQEFKRIEGVDLTSDKMVLQRLKDAAQQAKHDLSKEVKVEIKIPFISKGSATEPPKHLNVVVERKTLEKLVSPLLQRLEDPCLQALEDAQLKPEQIDEVILVGGMTRMPAVKKRCFQIFGKEPNDTVDPDEAVAVGAAIQGGLLQGFVKGVSLLDVTSLSLGIETQGGTMTTLIPRNTKIPCTMTEIFTTSAPNQPQISIHVLQGESQFAPDNKTLGRFELMGISPAPRGVPKIAVTFDIDVEGVVHVSAKDLDTGDEKTIEIIASSGLSDTEIDKLIRDNRQNEVEESRRDELAEMRNALMSYIFQTQFKLDTEASGFKGNARQALETTIQEARMTLGTSSDAGTLRAVLGEVQAAAAPLERFIENL